MILTMSAPWHNLPSNAQNAIENCVCDIYINDEGEPRFTVSGFSHGLPFSIGDGRVGDEKACKEALTKIFGITEPKCEVRIEKNEGLL